MPTAIQSWVRSIICCMCLMQLAEQLLPDNHYKKYIRLFCGVFFLILLITPLTDKASLSEIFQKQWKQALQQEEWNSIQMEQENLSGLQSTILTEAYREELQRQIKETADTEGMKNTEVRIWFQSEEDASIRRVIISGQCEDISQKENIREQVLQRLWEIYQIQRDNVIFLEG